MNEILSVLEDTILDTLKILPFLFLAYLIMEYLEHKTSEKTKKAIKKSGKYGPLIGSILGAFPQCGFSVTATNLFAGRVITIGTLFAVYLSTSDEMLPILLSEGVDGVLILKILGIKVLIGLTVGFIIDLILRKTKKDISESSIEDICEHDHCHCEDGILKSTLKHTFSILLFIFIVSLILNFVFEFIGEENIGKLILSNPIWGAFIACLIGLIPNCASSVILTKLYLSNVITLAVLIGGLLVNAGLGLMVLFRVNHDQKQNIKILITLYSVGAIFAMLLQLFI